MTDHPDTVDANLGQLPAQIALDGRRLTAAEFHGLAAVPPEFEWFENLKNPGTKRIYKNAIRDFMRFTGIVRPEEFRLVTRAHIIAWRDDLERRESVDRQKKTTRRLHDPQSPGSVVIAVRISLRPQRGS